MLAVDPGDFWDAIDRGPGYKDGKGEECNYCVRCTPSNLVNRGGNCFRVC